MHQIHKYQSDFFILTVNSTLAVKHLLIDHWANNLNIFRCIAAGLVIGLRNKDRKDVTVKICNWITDSKKNNGITNRIAFKKKIKNDILVCKPCTCAHMTARIHSVLRLNNSHVSHLYLHVFDIEVIQKQLKAIKLHYSIIVLLGLHYWLHPLNLDHYNMPS